MRRFQTAVRQRLDLRGGVSLSYIASVLRVAGFAVDYQDRYSDPVMPEPYASRLKDLLRFGGFSETEDSLRRINEIFLEFREASDHKGIDLVRTLLIRGKERADSLARNPRVSPQKRREKQEIAQWFRIWLQTPDLFFDWLEVRKQSADFPLQDQSSGSESPADNAPSEEV